LRIDNVSLGVELAPTWNGGAGTPADGPGTWNTVPGNTIWFDVAPFAWTDGRPAIFGAGNGAAGDVEVEGTVKPTSMMFYAAGSGAYRLTQGTDGLIDLDGRVCNVAANVDAEIAVIIANGSLNKLGDGTLTLSGANILTDTTVNAGTLTVNAGSIATLNVPAGSASLNATATADAANVSGTGLLGLDGAVTTLSVTGGTVNVGAGATITTATLSGGMVNPGTDSTFGTITAAGLTLESGGMLTFNIAGPSSLDQISVTGTGGLTINGGFITLLNSDGTDPFADEGTYNLIGYVGTLAGDFSNLAVVNTVQDRRYNFGAAGGFITLDIVETGFWNGGSGANVNWSNSANWNDIAPQTGDVLSFRTAGGLSPTLNNDLVNGRSFASLRFDSGAPAFTLDGNSIILTGEGLGDKILMVNNSVNIQTISLDIALGVDGAINAAAGDIEVGGAISGNHSLTKTGDYTLTLSGNNSYENGTIINAGAVAMSGLGTLGATTGALSLNGGSLDLGGTTQTVGAVSVTAAAGIGGGDLIADSYAVSNAAGNVAISADLGGSGGLTKSGGGTLTLSGNNTYAGATDITAGTLQYDGSLTGVGGPVTVPAGGTLGVGASGNIARDVAVSGGQMNLAGTLAAGTTLTLNSGTVNVATGGTVATATLKGGTVDTSVAPLAITDTLKDSGRNVFVWTAGTGSAFLASGDNIRDPGVARTLTLTGGTLTLEGPPAGPPVVDYARWFDASTLTGSTDDPVTQWNDGSVNAAHATVPGGNATPTLIADAGTGTGLPALQFAKNGGAGTSGALSFVRDSNIRTVFSIFKGNSFMLTDASAYNFHRETDDNATDPLFNGYASGNITGGQTYVNGALVNGTTFAMPTGLNNGYNLVEILTNGNPVQADSFNKDRTYHAGNQSQAEVIIYDRVLTNDERLAVEDYLNGKWFGIGGGGGGGGNFSTTSIAVTAGSVLAFPAVDCTLGTVTLVGNSKLTLSGATKVSVAGLTGNGTVAGTVTIPEGGMVSPGASSIGTITASGLTLDSGSFLTFEIENASSLDQVITGAGGLTINGGAIFLYEAGTTNKFSTTGVTYDLIGYSGGIGGDLSNLYVENRIPDMSYAFEANGSFITLTLAVAGYWNGGSGTDVNWSTTANWNGIDPVNGDVLVFKSQGGVSPALNNDLDNGRSFASLQFDSAAPAFTLDGNSIKLTGDGGQKIIMVNNSANVQTVNMDVELRANGKIDANSAAIAVGGNISGDYSLTKIGGSQLTLSGDNSHTGGTIINAGNVVIDNTSGTTTLGAAGKNLTMGGGSLDLGTSSQTIGALSVTAAAPSGDTISNGSLTGTSYNISNAGGEAVISASLLANGSIGLTKSGAGMATLSGTNTYTGLTNITAGTLKLGSAGALPNGNLDVGGTLDMNGVSPTIKALNGAGTGTITTSAGASTLTVGDGDASGTFSGKIQDGMSAVTVNTYELGASGSGTRVESGVGGLVPWFAKGTLPVGSILRSVSVNATIESSDAGDSWASDFVVYLDPNPEAPGTAALLQVGGYDKIGTASLVLNYLEGGGWSNGQAEPPSGTVNDTKTATAWSTLGDIDLNGVQLSIGDDYAGSTYSGTVSVTYGGTVLPVSLVKTGAGTLTLKGVVGYTGGTKIEGGTLYVYAADNAYAGGAPIPMGDVTIESGARLMGERSNYVGTLTMNGGTLSEDNGFGGSWTGPVILNETSTIQGGFNQSVNGDISGPGGLIKAGGWAGGGTLYLNGTNNTFEGGVTLRDGATVAIAYSTGLGTGTLQTAAAQNGTLNVQAEMSIANTINLPLGGNLTVTGSNAVLSGQISGSGTLTKAGGNTLTLSAANIHTGGTIVNAGTLTINGSLADSTMTIDTGTANGSGTLTFNIENETCDLIQVVNGGTLDITNLHIDINAGDLTELSYVLVDWGVDTSTAGILTGEAFAGTSVPLGWKIEYDLGYSQILLVPGQVGDTNLDGVVDAVDFITLKKNFGASLGGGLTVGDFDNTGTVDWNDLSTLAANMGNGGPAPATTPEPATLGLLAIGALAMLRRRRAA
jgi:autotransporter-associated beta strand protein